jgi:prepilin-type N-terminal cleavage/methylation domain-containing protein
MTMKKTKHPPTHAPLHLFGAQSKPWLGESMAPGTAQRKRRKILRRTGRGMTLIEVLIGLVILAVAVTVVAPLIVSLAFASKTMLLLALVLMKTSTAPVDVDAAGSVTVTDPPDVFTV